MTAFSALGAFRKTPAKAEEKRPAPKVVPLPPSAFADTWPDKPREAVQVGLRLVAEVDLETARAEATRVIIEERPNLIDHHQLVDTFNDALMRYVLARATCQPTDVSRPYWDCAEDNIRLALTDRGVQLLWEALEELKIAEDPLTDEVSDEDLAKLAVIIQDGPTWAALSMPRALRLRRWLRHALDELTAN